MLGVWMWTQNVQKFGASKVVDYCERVGVTDLYVLTKGLAGTIAFQSVFAPMVCERNFLREITEAAHKRGLRVHAWFTSASDQNYKELYPQSGRCHLVRGKDRGLISLADEGYLAYMEKIIQDLCRNYDIDGLHLDYIRYNHLLYGWAEEDLKRYAANGADSEYLKRLIRHSFLEEARNEALVFDAYRNGDESVLALARTRRQDVVGFARRLMDAARAEKNDLILSAALMPEGAYDDTAFSDLHYGQSYEDAAAIFDYALPMAYSAAYEKDACWVRRVAQGAIKRGLKTIMGLHAFEGGTGVSLKEDLAAIEDLPLHGVCLFREGATAFAYADGKHINICNALDVPVTRVQFIGEDERMEVTAGIDSGEEKQFNLPFEVETMRIFSGEEERCIYLARN